VDTFGNLHHITVDKGGFQIGPRPSKSVSLLLLLMVCDPTGYVAVSSHEKCQWYRLEG
jgi:hypothetical protein